MRAKINWRHLLVTGATLATLLLAAGARWKPNGLDALVRRLPDDAGRPPAMRGGVSRRGPFGLGR